MEEQEEQVLPPQQLQTPQQPMQQTTTPPASMQLPPIRMQYPQMQEVRRLPTLPSLPSQQRQSAPTDKQTMPIPLQPQLRMRTPILPAPGRGSVSVPITQSPLQLGWPIQATTQAPAGQISPQEVSMPALVGSPQQMGWLNPAQTQTPQKGLERAGRRETTPRPKQRERSLPRKPDRSTTAKRSIRAAQETSSESDDQRPQAPKPKGAQKTLEMQGASPKKKTKPEPPPDAEATKRPHSPSSSSDSDYTAYDKPPVHQWNPPHRKIQGPLYHIPVSKDPPHQVDFARIAPPPRLAYPMYPRAPQSNMEADQISESARAYGNLFSQAKAGYMTRADQATPASARLHDNGVTWQRYHAGLFNSVNPDPQAIWNHSRTGGLLPESFNTNWDVPNLRQGLISYNGLQPIRNSQDLQAFFIRM
jgi:hypothetical protein